jgi:hypothetical protein
MLLPIYVKGQASVLCSDNITAFEEYEPILYPIMWRRAGVDARFNFDLTIAPGGKFDYKILNPADKKMAVYDLQEAAVSSFSGWRFTNNTYEPVALKLNVSFELSGKVSEPDEIVKNKITINQGVVTIRVIATRLIPTIVSPNISLP